MVNGELQGWSEDPFQQHEARYFSAGRPTKLVRDGNVESYDEPPSDTYEPSPEFSEPPTEFSEPPPESYEPPPGLPRRSRAPMFATISAIGLVAALAGMALVGGTKSSGISPAAFVTQAAQHTLAQRTADVTVSGTVQADGQSADVYGTGEVNFSTNAMETDIGSGSSGQSFSEKEILINGSLYFTLSISGKSFTSLTGGRGWIQIPFQQSGPANLVGSDPLSSLTALEQEGNAVRTLGTETVDGASCTGYAVTVSKQAMLAAAKKEFARLGLSSTMTGQELNLIKGMSPPTVTVWIDAQGSVHRMSVNLGTNLLGSSPSGNIDMDFTHYGTPVQITAPAPSDTISYQSFLRALGS